MPAAWCFKNSLQEGPVDHHSLSLATRELLHESVGQFIERSYPSAIGQRVDDLAYHYGSSRNTPKKILYVRQAAGRARAAFTNDVAISYYERLLPLLPERERSSVLINLGEIWQLTGGWIQAEDAYRHALQLAGTDHDKAAAKRALGSLLAFNQSYDEALRWLMEARELYETVGDKSGVAATLEAQARIYLERGDYPRALSCSERQVEIARAQDNGPLACAAEESIGRIWWQRGEYRQAIDRLEHVLEVATSSRYAQMVVAAGNDIAGCYTEVGDYDRAVKNLQTALDAATAIGYQWACGLIVGNTGRLYFRLGEYERASMCFGYEVRLLTELGNWRRVVNSLRDISVLREAQGREREAERLLDWAIHLGRAVEAPYFLCELLFTRSEFYTRRMCYEDAKVHNDEALEIATALDDKDVQLRARILDLRLRAALSEPKDEVVKQFEGLLSRSLGDREMAAVHYEVWRLDPMRETSRKAAASLYRRLHERMPDIVYRRRYHELTGEALGQPPALPPLPKAVAEGGDDLDEVLKRAFDLTQVFTSSNNRRGDFQKVGG